MGSSGPAGGVAQSSAADPARQRNGVSAHRRDILVRLREANAGGGSEDLRGPRRVTGDLDKVNLAEIDRSLSYFVSRGIGERGQSRAGGVAEQGTGRHRSHFAQRRIN